MGKYVFFVLRVSDLRAVCFSVNALFVLRAVPHNLANTHFPKVGFGVISTQARLVTSCMAMFNPSVVTGKAELCALTHGAGTASKCITPPACSRMSRSKVATLRPALRLFPRLSRGQAQQAGGKDVAANLLPPAAGRKRKRIDRMLSESARLGRPSRALPDCASRLLAAKSVNELRQLRAIVPGSMAGQASNACAPADPRLHRQRGCIEWAELEIPIVQPQACKCGSGLLTSKRLGRYGPVAVLDAAKVHVAWVAHTAKFNKVAVQTPNTHHVNFLELITKVQFLKLISPGQLKQVRS